MQKNQYDYVNQKIIRENFFFFKQFLFITHLRYNGTRCVLSKGVVTYVPQLLRTESLVRALLNYSQSNDVIHITKQTKNV